MPQMIGQTISHSGIVQRNYKILLGAHGSVALLSYLNSDLLTNLKARQVSKGHSRHQCAAFLRTVCVGYQVVPPPARIRWPVTQCAASEARKCLDPCLIVHRGCGLARD